MTGTVEDALAGALICSIWQGALVVAGYLCWGRALRRGSPAARATAAAVTIGLVCSLPLLDLVFDLLLDLVVRRLGDTGLAVPALPLDRAHARELLAALTPRGTGVVVAIWAMGAIGVLARIAGGVISARRVRLGETAELPRLASLARTIGLVRPPRASLTAASGVPCVVGWWRPTLLVPAGLAEALSPDELDAIVLHELAHVRRRDTALHLALRIAGAFAWHQLALHWLFRRLGHAREQCCDELAVRAGGQPVALARALVALEERRSDSHAWMAASTGGGLRDRVVHLLGTAIDDGSHASIDADQPAASSRRSPRAARSRRAVAGGFGGAAMALLCTAAIVASVPRADLAAMHYVVRAHDPAGPFTVELAGERLVAASIAGRSVPAAHIVQHGRDVHLLGAGGEVALALEVFRPGGIRWDARPAARTDAR